MADVRISCYETTRDGKEYNIAMVVFSPEVVRRFEFPFIKLEATDTCLIFKQCAGKTARTDGINRLANNKVQFMREEDVITLLDYCGEFPLQEEGGDLYVRKMDRSGYSEIHKPTRGCKKVMPPRAGKYDGNYIKQEAVIVESNNWRELVRQEIERLQAYFNNLENERARLVEEIKRVELEQDKYTQSISALKNALDIPVGGGKYEA